jgi:hypothetical protein
MKFLCIEKEGIKTSEWRNKNKMLKNVKSIDDYLVCYNCIKM